LSDSILTSHSPHYTAQRSVERILLDEKNIAMAVSGTFTQTEPLRFAIVVVQ